MMFELTSFDSACERKTMSKYRRRALGVLGSKRAPRAHHPSRPPTSTTVEEPPEAGQNPMTYFASGAEGNSNTCPAASNRFRSSS